MVNKERDPQEFLPMSQIDYYILLNLFLRSRHGYEIMKLVEEDMSQDIPAPKIYRYLRNLTDSGLIEIDEEATARADDPRRRYYKITGLGQNVCRYETNRLNELVRNAQGIIGDLNVTTLLGGTQ